MSSQSDIPSQAIPAAVDLRRRVPVAGNAALVQNLNGFVVSTYNTRPANAVDVILTPDIPLDGNIVNPILPQIITGTFHVPDGFVFIMRSLYVSLGMRYTGPLPGVPDPLNNPFLTTVAGDSNPAGYPAALGIVLGININQLPTVLQGLQIFEAALSDYTLPLYFPVEPSSEINIVVTNDPVDPTAAFDPFIFALQLILCGTLTPSTGLPASDEVLTQFPIPVRL